MLKRFLALITLSFCMTHIAAHTVLAPHSQLAREIKIDQNAVVSIFVEKVNTPPPFSEPSPQPGSNHKNESLGLGSGVIVDAKNGIIITNAHVVHQGKVIIVHLKDGRRYVGHVIGQDTGFDIAVVKIKAKNLSSIAFADSDNLKVGDSVAAIGSPFGLDQTVTSGIVSALNVSRPQIEGFQSFIQTDAPINPGNSGGPLINSSGKVVGINTAILGPGGNIGIGFSIPSNMVKSVYHQLLQHHHVERGALGVIAQKLTGPLKTAFNIPATTEGTLVSQVIQGSPAETAGIKVGDVITSVNNKPIRDQQQLRNMLGLMPPGSNLDVKVQRHNQSTTLHAKVGSPDTMTQHKMLPYIGGEELQDFKELNGSGEHIMGAQVTHLTPTSEGALAGIHPGDIIIAAANQPVHNTDELLRILHQHKNDEQILMQVKRGPVNAFIIVQNS
jgi:serine protease Do